MTENQRIRMPLEILAEAGVPHDVVAGEPALYVNTFVVTRMLFQAELYKMIVNVPGSVMEFGVKWGQGLLLWHSLRLIYDPHNIRRLVGFDTFTGFPSVHPNDGQHVEGELAVTPGYERYLDELLASRELPVYGYERRSELVVGDVTKTIHEYLDRHPETIVALAYFDVDLYEPTRECLAAIRPYLTKGSVLAFDEPAYPDWPGETIAIREVLGLDRVTLRRTPQSTTIAYCVVE